MRKKKRAWSAAVICDRPQVADGKNFLMVRVAQRPVAGSPQDCDEHHRLYHARRAIRRRVPQPAHALAARVKDGERHHALTCAGKALCGPES